MHHFINYFFCTQQPDDIAPQVYPSDTKLGLASTILHFQFQSLEFCTTFDYKILPIELHRLDHKFLCNILISVPRVRFGNAYVSNRLRKDVLDALCAWPQRIRAS